MAVNHTQLKKCSIVALDGPGTVEALFNPKEISIDKSVPWSKHRTSKGDSPHLEFTASDGRNLSLELFFDTYEEKTDVYKGYVEKLEKFTQVRNVTPESERRPPRVMVVWGEFPNFKGVIESLQTKYTMFLPDGTPVRATCSIKLKEAVTTSNGGGNG